jgi:hypothetical protein
MTALATKWPTLLDVSKRYAPDGGISDIAELMTETNEILEDMPWHEGNLPTGHRHTIRTGLPAPTWRKLYGGVQPTKSTTAQVTDQVGMLEAYAEVDKALADLNGNTAAFRLSEDRAHIDGMSKELGQTLFYGNETTEPEAFTGLGPRYSSLSAANADNIIDHGGNDSDLTSIWLVVWGDQGAFGIYPKGSKAGLEHEDKGQVTIENVDGASGRMEAYRSHYKHTAGLGLKDWRQVVRIANVDLSTLDTLTSTDELVVSMVRASEKVHNLKAGRAVWYMNRRVRTALRLGILEKIANNLTWESVAGKTVMMFDEIPVKRCDALISGETRVT